MASATTAPGNISIPGERRSVARLLRPILMLGGVAVVVVASVWWWLGGGRYVSVDDSYVRAAKLAIADDISGIVGEVDVHEGQHVNKGDVLLKLRDRQAQIGLSRGQGEPCTSRPDDGIDEARLSADAARHRRATSANAIRSGDVRQVFQPGQIGCVPRAEYDDARFKLAADTASVDSLKQQADVQLAKLGGDPNVDVTTTPQYLRAQADVEEWQRQLDHTVLRAPFSGTVTNVEATQPGMYLAIGTAAFGLVSDEDVWVEANPKETDLTAVKPGDPVTITVDTYPNHPWHGAVESIAPASASEFSVLPAQNSSGNWVKVVQRLPVRIRVDRQAGDPAAARRHERGGGDRHRPRPPPVRPDPVSGVRAGEKVPHRALITVCAMIATLMQALDTTIANVALPYMQAACRRHSIRSPGFSRPTSSPPRS